MESLAAGIGRALRRVRRERGFTLREVARRSEDRFKPTSVAGYERGERSISVERFCQLASLYGIAPDRLLGEAVRAWEGRPGIVIDLTQAEGLEGAQARLVAGFVDEVLQLRGERNPETITLRAGDLEALASASGRRPEELLEAVRDVLRPPGP